MINYDFCFEQPISNGFYNLLTQKNKKMPKDYNAKLLFLKEQH